ncbi:DEAD/DEAH box helicase family protein [Brevundimonas sp.]|uniref:DEAD/DEAH box helicase family protein n=1 Tax=Brevundimonas sp. TaxID=1871086 RepID=UPI0026116CB6|nr:DEAD/DEAH box helicase family protein [Brevundimonas sp.]
MRVGLLTGGPGSGKTTEQRRRVIAERCLHVLAMPSIPLIEEQRGAFHKEAPSLRVFEVHHEASHRSVERQLSDVLERIAGAGIAHAVVMVTHRSLIDKDLSAFSGWRLWIDEAPDSVKCGHIGLSADTCGLFAQAFDLRPFGRAGWAELVPAGERPSWVKLKRDTLLRGATELFEAVKATGHVFVDLDTWDGAEGFSWCAVWTPLSLSRFGSVVILGASYMASVGGVICATRMGDVIQFDEERIVVVRSGQPTIRVHWFADRPAGTSEWATKEGRAALRDIAAFLRVTEPTLGFWSANSNAQDFLDAYMPGTLARPKSAGLNRYRDLCSCALFYGAGATPGDAILLRDFGFSKAMIRRAREEEDIFQFVLRGSLRNGDYAGPYEVYLYSRSQAETLRDRLEGEGFCDIELVAQSHVIQATSLPPPHPMNKPQPSAADKRARKSELQRQRRWFAASQQGRPQGAVGRPPNPP